MPTEPELAALVEDHVRQMIAEVIPAIEADERQAARLAVELRFPRRSLQPEGQDHG